MLYLLLFVNDSARQIVDEAVLKAAFVTFNPYATGSVTHLLKEILILVISFRIAYTA